MAIPPYKHQKVFQYPRWHSYSKVLKDLEVYGTVKTYDNFPNEEEGEKEYQRVLMTNEKISNINNQPEMNLEEMFVAWTDTQSSDCQLYLIEVSPDQSSIQLSYRNDEFWLTIPSPEDPDSVYFIDAGPLKSPWISPVNSMLTEDSQNLSFSDVLTNILDIIIKHSKKKTKKR
jgi:hypothetical protein